MIIFKNPIKNGNIIEDDDTFANTTYSRDFVPHHRARSSRPIRKDHLNFKDDDPVDTCTSYKTDFIEHKLPTYYFLPRDQAKEPIQFHRPKTGIKTDKRYFNRKELRLIRGYYNPCFNLDNVVLSEQNPRHFDNSTNKRYETMKPVLERSKSFNFNYMKNTPERVAVNNQNIKARIFETFYNLKPK